MSRAPFGWRLDAWVRVPAIPAILLSRATFVAFGITVDNNGAVLFRPGVSMTFPHL